MKTVIVHFNNGFRVSCKDISYVNAIDKIKSIFFGNTYANKISHVDYR